MTIPSTDISELIVALDGEPGVAARAADAIARAGAREAAPKLIELLRVTNDHNVRNAVALALSDLREPRAFDEIVKLLRDARTLGNRGTLLYALRAFDCSNILSMLIDFVIEGSYEASREAMHLIETIDIPIDNNTWAAYVAKLKGALERATEERKPLLREVLAMLGVDDP